MSLWREDARGRLSARAYAAMYEITGVPSLDEDLFRAIRRTGGRRGPDVGGELLEGVVWPKIHAAKGPGGVHVGAAAEHLRGRIHGVVVGRGGAEVHCDVFGLGGRGVHALGVARVGRRSYAGPDVSLPEVALESGVRQVVVRGRVA